MGLETLCGGCQEHTPSEGAISGDGGRAARDWKGVGHGAAQVPRVDQEAPEG